LRNLVSEDFVYLFRSKENDLKAYERKYGNTQGAKYENEVAKILARYKNEGKRTESYDSTSELNKKKQVSFNGKVDQRNYINVDSQI